MLLCRSDYNIFFFLFLFLFLLQFCPVLARDLRWEAKAELSSTP